MAIKYLKKSPKTSSTDDSKTAEIVQGLLKDLEKSLKWLVLKCPGDNKPDCPIIDELAKG